MAVSILYGVTNNGDIIDVWGYKLWWCLSWQSWSPGILNARYINRLMLQYLLPCSFSAVLEVYAKVRLLYADARKLVDTAVVTRSPETAILNQGCSWQLNSVKHRKRLRGTYICTYCQKQIRGPNESHCPLFYNSCARNKFRSKLKL
jgi:hypothetical protein